MEMSYRCELCRITNLIIKSNKNLKIIYFAFCIIGRNTYTYNLEIKNPTDYIIKTVCKICNVNYFDTDVELNIKPHEYFPFFVIFEYFNNEYQDMICFAYPQTLKYKIKWIFSKKVEDKNFDISYLSNKVTKKYNDYEDLIISQTSEKLNIEKLKESLRSSIKDFDKYNKNDSLIHFIIEIFINSNIICNKVYSHIVDGDEKYIIFRNKKFTKSLLSLAFEIENIGDNYRLVSSDPAFYFPQ